MQIVLEDISGADKCLSAALESIVEGKFDWRGAGLGKGSLIEPSHFIRIGIEVRAHRRLEAWA